MEIKKCANCGDFILNGADICVSCADKLNFGKTVLKSYFDDVYDNESVQAVSASTGISPTIVQNYMIENKFMDAPICDTDDYCGKLPF